VRGCKAGLLWWEYWEGYCGDGLCYVERSRKRKGQGGYGLLRTLSMMDMIWEKARHIWRRVIPAFGASRRHSVGIYVIEGMALSLPSGGLECDNVARQIRQVTFSVSVTQKVISGFGSWDIWTPIVYTMVGRPPALLPKFITRMLT